MTRSFFTTFCLALFLGVQLALGSSSTGRATPESQNRNLATRIVGGTKANPKRFPYYTQVRLYTLEHPKGRFCGGTLIAGDAVLTAAHCLGSDDYYDNVTAIDVWVNSTTTAFSEYEYYRAAIQVVVHPLYKPARYSAFSTIVPNDIGLIFLDEPVTGVPLVKLNRNPSVPVSTAYLKVIGLGATSFNFSADISEVYPKELMQTSIKVNSMLSCKKVYGSTIIGNASICAGGGGVRGLCDGDPGGPLLLTKGSPQSDVMVGIASATFCPKENGYPDVFAKVSYYAKWIDEQICAYSMYKPAKCRSLPPASSPPSPLRAATVKPTVKPTTGKP